MPPPPFWSATPPTSTTANSSWNYPFSGGYRGFSWNPRGLLAWDLPNQAAKREQLIHFLRGHDFGGVVDTHGSDGAAAAMETIAGTTPFWSHMPGVRTHGGVGLLVQNAFLARFGAIGRDDWDVIEEGRVAALHLRGPEGSLTVVIAYFPSGNDKAAARKALVDKMRTWLKHHEDELIIFTGDFNFVTDTTDRFDFTALAHTGYRDAGEAHYWTETLEQHTTLRENHRQKDHTFHAPDGRVSSRLDRVYSTHHTADMFTGALFSSRLPVLPQISDHDGISFGKRAPEPETRARTLSSATIQDPDWAVRVSRAYHQRRRQHAAAALPDPDGIEDLAMLKQSMQDVSKTMAHTRHGRDYLYDDDRTLTSDTAFRVLAAVSRGLIRSPTSLADALPTLWRSELQLLRPGTTLAEGIRKLKNKAIDLVKDELLGQMQELQAQGDDLTEEERGARKNNIHNILARLTRRTQTIALRQWRTPTAT